MASRAMLVSWIGFGSEVKTSATDLSPLANCIMLAATPGRMIEPSSMALPCRLAMALSNARCGPSLAA